MDLLLKRLLGGFFLSFIIYILFSLLPVNFNMFEWSENRQIAFLIMSMIVLWKNLGEE